MTFPAIVETTAVPIAGVLALIAGIIAARKGVSMFLVAVYAACCVCGRDVNLRTPSLLNQKVQ